MRACLCPDVCDRRIVREAIGCIACDSTVCDTRLSTAVRFEMRDYRRAVHIGQEVAQLLAEP